MNKKITVLLIVSILVVFAVLIYKKDTARIVNDHDYSEQMRGKITKITDNSITVEGVAISKDSTSQKNRTVIFIIDSSTTFKQSVIDITDTDAPVRADKPGERTDLVVNTSIVTIKGEDNLFTSNSTAATEIYYLGTIYPKP